MNKTKLTPQILESELHRVEQRFKEKLWSVIENYAHDEHLLAETHVLDTLNLSRKFYEMIRSKYDCSGIGQGGISCTPNMWQHSILYKSFPEEHIPFG